MGRGRRRSTRRRDATRRTLTEPGDVLHYLYDYGDNWQLTLRLEDVLPAESDCPATVVVDGERAAPPEDCGHLVDAQSLAEVVADPALFEPERLNKGFGDAYRLREAGVDVRLVDMVHQLTYTPYGDDLTTTTLALAGPEPVDTIDWTAHLRAYQWFLDRAGDGGIPLTTAGYLKPADVEVVSNVVPAMHDWFGEKNRETHCYPLLRFREGVQAMGLLRKSKGTLLLTKVGEAARGHTGKLVKHLASRLIPKSGDEFDVQATLLMMAYAAASPGAAVPFPTILALLAELGWRHPSGQAPNASVLYQLPAHHALLNVTDRPAALTGPRIVSPAAAALARRALRTDG